MDFYSLFADEDPRMQAKAMADAWRQQQGLAGQLVYGTPQNQAAAKMLSEQAATGQQMAGRAGENAFQKRQAVELQSQQEAAAMARQDDQQQFTGGENVLDRDLTRGEGKANRGNQWGLAKLREAGDDARLRQQIQGQRDINHMQIEAGRYDEKAKGAKTIASGQAAALGDLNSNLDILKDLSTAWGSETRGTVQRNVGSGLSRLGVLGTGDWANKVANSDVAKFNNRRDLAAQVIGTYLEGGKLSDKDKPFYFNLMPAPGDSEDIKNSKVADLEKRMKSKHDEKLRSFGAAGYDVSGYGPQGGGEAKVVGGVTWRKVGPNPEDWETDGG